LRFLDRLQPLALLVLRLVIGTIMIAHGYGKVFGGFSHVHDMVQHLGFPGWMAYLLAGTEFFGGILIIGGLLAVFSLISLLVTLLMMLVPLPMPANVDAAQAQSAQAVTRIMFGVMALVHMIVCAVGVSWLVYFNRQKVRDAFTSATGQALESRRPILISVIAVLNMIGAVSCLLMVFIPMPGVLFGWMFDGWGKVALCLAFAALTASVGVGLWRLKEWGRLLALAMQAFGLMNTAVYLLRPELMLRYSAEIQQRLTPMQPQLPDRFQTMIYSVSFGFGVLLCIAIAAILIYYRKAFQRAVEPLQIESASPL